MKTSEAGIALIQSFESCLYSAKPDTDGRWALGYGHTDGVGPGDGCSQKQANEWLHDDVKAAEYAINTQVKVPLTQNQYDALVSLIYNIGADAFTQSTLLKDLNAGNYKAAALWFPQWDHVDGIEIAGLERRRQAEMDLFNS